MVRRISVRGIVLHNNKLLCVRLNPYEGAIHVSKDEWWCLPGGGLDEGEPLLAGIEREMLEETGVKPEIGRLLYVQQFAHGGKDYLEFFFHITNDQDYLNIDLKETTHGTLELAEIKFIEPKKVPLVMPKFLAEEDLVAHAKSDSPTRFFAEY